MDAWEKDAAALLQELDKRACAIQSSAATLRDFESVTGRRLAQIDRACRHLKEAGEILEIAIHDAGHTNA